MRVAVTGAGGRLGRALLAALEEAPFTGPFGPIGWTRADFDLDRPESLEALLDRDRPELVVHAAAWTDVDGCARDPDLAMARNGRATGVLAEACVARAIDLVLVSTNEVFDGRRTDGRGYEPDAPPAPPNPYGRSKLEGEERAREAFDRVAGVRLSGYRGPDVGRGARAGIVQLAIVRTGWLFGPPGGDFPTKILAAGRRARAAGEALAVVADEFGTPTYAIDLAEAIVEIIGSGAFTGIHHLVGRGVASRADWARELFRQAGEPIAVRDVPAASWQRASTPPRWGVLAPTPLPSGESMPAWPVALGHYLPLLLRQPAARDAS